MNIVYRTEFYRKDFNLKRFKNVLTLPLRHYITIRIIMQPSSTIIEKEFLTNKFY